MLLVVLACWVVLAMVLLPVAAALGHAGRQQDRRHRATEATARRRRPAPVFRSTSRAA
ncbi:hypothetical protein JD78_03905 [Modestobacter roseus]|uniref:Uncharacterized protein n=2 Tax=Modestobacter roseus TaxID=1181884 RepID=A0A562IWG1_9ACTN|nr:hypothetical protein [Modestobacter roseus]TWH75349.1 hypothetical protein JD78_03905 [Modestobacter roseus]